MAQESSVFGVKGFHFDSRVLIPASSLPNAPPLVSTVASLLMGTLPYPSLESEGEASAGRLIPTILGAFTLDQ